jgi:hypothetical protein
MYRIPRVLVALRGKGLDYRHPSHPLVAEQRRRLLPPYPATQLPGTACRLT